MLFHLDFTNNTVFTCYFFFFLNINLQFLIPVVIAQIFNPIAELLIPIGIRIRGEKSEIEMHQTIVEAKIGKCSI